MKRRLSIAIALAGDPKIVFLDEPSSGLDPKHRRDIWDIILSTKSKRTVLITTHSMEEADVLCCKIALINLGVLVSVGSPH